MDDGQTSVVVPQVWLPGWRAWVDGLPAPTMAWNELLAAELGHPSGCHSVDFAYRPLADFVGMGVTSITLIGLAVWAILYRRKAASHA